MQRCNWLRMRAGVEVALALSLYYAIKEENA